MTVSTKKTQDNERAYETAMEILDREWLEAGASQEELEQSAELTEIFDRLQGSGYSSEIVRAAWEADYPNNLCLYLRLLAIAERALEPNDPALIQLLTRLAGLYHAQGDYAAAEPLYARVLAIQEKTLGEEHPATRKIRADYGRLLRETGREAEAAALDTSS